MTTTAQAAPTIASATPSFAGGLGGDVRARMPAGEAFGFASDGTRLAVIVRDADVYRLIVIDLQTGAARTIREERNGTAIEQVSLRESVVAFVESTPASEPMTINWRVLAGPWEDSPRIRELDDIRAVPLAGGDSWNPLPNVQTNGFEIAWIHARTGNDLEVRVRTVDSGIATAFRGGPVFFALGRYGDIALSEIALAGQTSPTRLLLVSHGVTRVVASRAPELGGIVARRAGRLAWTFGYGFVQPPNEVEFITPATGARELVSPPAGVRSVGRHQPRRTLHMRRPSRGR